MKRRPASRKLRVENLEERRLTATLAGSFSSTSIAPKTEAALVSTIGPIEQVSLTRSIVDTSSWKMGVRVNHNETLVRSRPLKRRSSRKLRIESLEDRKLTATLAGSFTSIPVAPTSSTALVSTISPIQQVSLSRVLVDTSGWVKGLRPNHNETLVRSGRRIKAKDR